MKASEMVEALQVAIERHGDFPVEIEGYYTEEGEVTEIFFDPLGSPFGGGASGGYGRKGREPRFWLYPYSHCVDMGLSGVGVLTGKTIEEFERKKK